jgi:hypothetical protein
MRLQIDRDRRVRLRQTVTLAFDTRPVVAKISSRQRASRSMWASGHGVRSVVTSAFVHVTGTACRPLGMCMHGPSNASADR